MLLHESFYGEFKDQNQTQEPGGINKNTWDDFFRTKKQFESQEQPYISLLK